MDIISFITSKEISFSRIGTLFALIIVLAIALFSIASIDPQIDKNSIYYVIVFIVASLLISSYWYYKRTKFPRGKKDKVNIVLAITTEDEKQKTRITNDTANQIIKLLHKYDLSRHYEVVVLPNYLSKKAQEIIRLNKDLRNNSEDDFTFSKFENMKRRLNAKFIVYGDLIKRDNPNGKYLLSIEALLIHTPPTTVKQKIALSKDFSNLWKDEIQILESDELNGFKSNAESLFFTASFMLGLATFVDNNFLHGIEIWDRLEDYVNTNSELKEHLPKIRELKSTALFLQSQIEYLFGNIEESITLTERMLSITPNDYNSHITASIKELKVKKRPEIGLAHIEKAKLFAGKEGTWRYNKFYILITMHRFSDSLRILDEILNYQYKNELNTVLQVIAYNNDCLDEDPTHFQTHFIVGTFIFKKLNNPIEAFEHLENFIQATSDLNDWQVLRERAQEYLKEIYSIINQ